VLFHPGCWFSSPGSVCCFYALGMEALWCSVSLLQNSRRFSLCSSCQFLADGCCMLVRFLYFAVCSLVCLLGHLLGCWWLCWRFLQIFRLLLIVLAFRALSVSLSSSVFLLFGGSLGWNASSLVGVISVDSVRGLPT
jgi:hypothetical protein